MERRDVCLLQFEEDGCVLYRRSGRAVSHSSSGSLVWSEIPVLILILVLLWLT